MSASQFVTATVLSLPLVPLFGGDRLPARPTRRRRSPAKLAAHAGLAPVSRDFGTVSGNHRQPRRFHRRLRHILWMAPSPPPENAPPPAPTKRRNAPKVKTTAKPYSPSPDDASTSSGHSSATARPSPDRHRRSVPQPESNRSPPTRPRSRRPLQPAHQDQPESHGGSGCGPGLGERRPGGGG
ncbi:transposase [Micromonospora sp. NPDC005171]|uniref:transposase n=1 Tax=Micromonospora sp. NPDC005171 TaxID=3156866 RepID=UPI0033B28626